MEIIAIVIALVALAVAVAARSRAAGLQREIDDARIASRRVAANLEEAVEAQIANVRQLVASVAAGEALTSEMILEGRLWRDVPAAEGQALVEAGAHVLDVRTPQETALGVIPGARLVPIDQLEERLAEVPRDGRPMLVACAGGGRSAAACELLSSRGYSGLFNLEGGMGAWTGPTEKPGTRA